MCNLPWLVKICDTNNKRDFQTILAFSTNNKPDELEKFNAYQCSVDDLPATQAHCHLMLYPCQMLIGKSA